MEIPKDFYTPATFFTLGGMATAVWVVTSSIGHLVTIGEKPKRWVGFLLSLLFALLGVSLLQDKTPATWIIGAVNACLVYLTAVGANTVAAPAMDRGRPASPVKETAALVEKKRSRFFASWW